MITAFRIKVTIAVGALVIATLVFVDRHFMFAYAAQNGFGIKFISVPYFGFMPCYFFMTKKTWVISIATFKPDSNNIDWRMIMRAAGLIVNRFTFYFNHFVSFNSQLIAPAISQLFYLHQCIYRDAQPMFAQQYYVLP